MSGVKVTHPLRFIGFFGLFIVFIFLGVKACQDQGGEDSFVASDEIQEESDESINTKNAVELSDFIKDAKKDLETQKKEEVLKKNEAALAKKNTKEAVPEKQKERKAVKKEASATIAVQKKKATTKKISPPKKKSVTETIRLFGVNGDLSQTSKALLKKTYNSRKSATTIKVYGYYSPSEPKTAAFDRANQIKTELLKLGVSRSKPIYIIPKQNSVPGLVGEVVM